MVYDTMLVSLEDFMLDSLECRPVSIHRDGRGEMMWVMGGRLYPSMRDETLHSAQADSFTGS